MSPRRLIRESVLAEMAARRKAGATIAALAAAYPFDDETIRRALARRRLSQRQAKKAAPIKIRCDDKSVPLLRAEAAKLGLRPAALAAQLLDFVLQGNLVDAVRDGG